MNHWTTTAIDCFKHSKHKRLNMNLNWKLQPFPQVLIFSKKSLIVIIAPLPTLLSNQAIRITSSTYERERRVASPLQMSILTSLEQQISTNEYYYDMICSSWAKNSCSVSHKKIQRRNQNYGILWLDQRLYTMSMYPACRAVTVLACPSCWRWARPVHATLLLPACSHKSGQTVMTQIYTTSSNFQ